MAKSCAVLIFQYMEEMHTYTDDMFCVSSEKRVHDFKRLVFTITFIVVKEKNL